MIVTLNGNKAYLDVKKINGMMFEPSNDKNYPSRLVIFFEGSQMTFTLPCSNEYEAFKIIDIIQENKKEITQLKEIDNFKEALEYALKIVKG